MTALDLVTVCLLDDNPLTAHRTSGSLKSAGYKVKAFDHPDAFLRYARDHHPTAAVVDLGGSHGKGLEIRAHLREVSPVTSVILSLKIHQDRARFVLPGDELVKMIKHICAGKSLCNFAESGGLYPQ